MGLEIDIIYFVKKIPGDKFAPEKYVIKAPEMFNQIAEDYGIVVSSSFAEIYPERIVIYQGNEREKGKTRDYTVYAFEKINKIPGKNFKKYRFTEEEVKSIYDKAPHPSIDTLSEGRYRKKHSSGSLVCIEYSHMLLAGIGKKMWGVIFDKEPNSVYDIKHDFISEKPEGILTSFYVVKEYHLDDVAVVFNNADELVKVLPYAWNGDLNAKRKVLSLIGVEI